MNLIMKMARAFYKMKITMTTIVSIILLIFICGILIWEYNNTYRVDIKDGEGDCVVLLHGLGRTSGSMDSMADFLNENGYKTVNVNYPSSKEKIQYLSRKYIRESFIDHCPEDKKIHFVTHSMGGIVTRHFLIENRPKNLGRVVMLAPPNKGSELADELMKWRFMRWVRGEALSQLGTGEGSLPLNLSLPKYEFGVIAGNKSYNPVFSKIIPGPDDGKVAVEKTKLEGMKDFMEVEASHTFLMSSDEVQEAVKRFFESGEFED
jgi:triacylglycerol lipase